MKTFLIYIGLLLTVLGTSAASENIIKQGKNTVLFSKKESSNYFSILRKLKQERRKAKAKIVIFLSATIIQFPILL